MHNRVGIMRDDYSITGNRENGQFGAPLVQLATSAVKIPQVFLSGLLLHPHHIDEKRISQPLGVPRRIVRYLLKTQTHLILDALRNQFSGSLHIRRDPYTILPTPNLKKGFPNGRKYNHRPAFSKQVAQIK